jgi:hypothetical protein
LEVINQQVTEDFKQHKKKRFFFKDNNFTTQLELAVRFGKTLIIQKNGYN